MENDNIPENVIQFEKDYIFLNLRMMMFSLTKYILQ